MTYQKPVTSQRFDKPVYQLQQPKKKMEKKRPFVTKTQRADDQGQTGSKSPSSAKSDESLKSRKPARSTKSLVSKKPAGMKKATRSVGRKKLASGRKGQSSVKSSRPATARRRRA